MATWKVRARSEQSSGMIADREEVARALRLLADPEHGCELFAMPAYSGSTLSGSDIEGLLIAADSLPAGSGVYLRVNPCPLGLGRPTKNAEIVKRRWLYIDVDPIKPSDHRDNPATDEEKAGTLQVASSIFEYLSAAGWPAPIVMDSGNGHGILYRIDAPNDRETQRCLRDFLRIIGERFKDEPALIDQSVHNANRLMKLPGTWARKGTASDERPYRPARLVSVPETVCVVSLEMIAAVTGTEAKDSKPVVNGSSFTLRATNGDVTAYARRALDNEIARVMMGRANNRNNDLNRASFSLGQLVGGGELNRDEVEKRLADAARAVGLDDAEITGTLRSGLDAGVKEPRKAPERKEAPKWKPPEKGESKAQQKLIYPLDELLSLELPEPRWAVPGLLSEGLSILAGKPKLGKSWLALNLGMTLAAGGMALGSIRVQPCDVLYLALEDRVRRIQDRARKVMKGLGTQANKRLSFAVAWPRQHEGGVMELATWAESVDNPMLIIIDVWAKFRPPVNQRGNAYEQDYEALSEVKSCADHYGTSVLAVHHTRKGAAEDVFDEISGTLGIAGAADGSIVLARSRNQNEGTLAMTGRDIEEQVLSVEFHPETFTWTSHGNANERLSGKLEIKIIEYLKTLGGRHTFVKDVSDHIEETADSVRRVLHRLLDKGLVRRVGQGWAYPAADEIGDDPDRF